MGCSFAASSANTTGIYSHSPPSPRITAIPVIFLAAQWWNPSRTFSISPVTTQLSLLYISTDCATALYIIPRDRTVALVFVSTLSIIPHSLCAFLRF